jgi:hypothetical protein
MRRVGSPASEDRTRERRRPRLDGTAGKAVLVLVFVGLFLTIGVPRWLAGDHGPAPSNGSGAFAKLCRDHGGTPKTTPASGTNAVQQVCTVRYGRNVYRMDAVTANGFDEDTAGFQRQGCEEARREERSSSDAGKQRRVFVYHPDTGVCEHRP